MKHDLNTRHDNIANGLEFLGIALLQIGKMSDTESEKLGCLLLSLAEYARMPDKEE